MGAEIAIMAEVAEGADEALGSRFSQLAIDTAHRYGNHDASTVTWVATEGRLVRRAFEHIVIADDRRLYVLEVTGGEFVVRKSGPSGQPIPPFGELAIFVDWETLEPFITGGGGFGPTDLSSLGETHVESLAGVSPTPRDHDVESSSRRAAATKRSSGHLGVVSDLIVATSRAARPNRLRGEPGVGGRVARCALRLPSLPGRTIRGLPRTARRLITGRAIRDFSWRTASEFGYLRRSR